MVLPPATKPVKAAAGLLRQTQITNKNNYSTLNIITITSPPLVFNLHYHYYDHEYNYKTASFILGKDCSYLVSQHRKCCDDSNITLSVTSVDNFHSVKQSCDQSSVFIKPYHLTHWKSISLNTYTRPISLRVCKIRVVHCSSNAAQNHTLR